MGMLPDHFLSYLSSVSSKLVLYNLTDFTLQLQGKFAMMILIVGLLVKVVYFYLYGIILGIILLELGIFMENLYFYDNVLITYNGRVIFHDVWMCFYNFCYRSFIFILIYMCFCSLFYLFHFQKKHFR